MPHQIQYLWKMTSKILHEVKKFVMTTKSLSWCQNAKGHLDWINFYLNASPNSIPVKNDIKNTSWSQKVCHDDKKFVMMSKNTSWRQTWNSYFIEITYTPNERNIEIIIDQICFYWKHRQIITVNDTIYLLAHQQIWNTVDNICNLSVLYPVYPEYGMHLT